MLLHKKNVNAAASKIACQFVSDLLCCDESLYSVSPKPHKGNFFSAASKMHENLLNKMIGQAQCRVQITSNECEHPLLEEYNIHPCIDLHDSTQEVMNKCLKVYKTEMVGESAMSDISPVISTQEVMKCDAAA